MRSILVLTALSGLAACGGGGGGRSDGGSGGSPGDGSDLVSHADQLRALDAAAARLADLDPTESLPASGSATYAGHLGATAVIDGAPVFVTAAVELTARFGSGTIFGSFATVRAADGSVDGAGQFANGTFGPAGIETGVTGTLVRAGATHAIAGDLRGAFLGPGAQAVVGAIEAGLSRGGVPSGRFDGEVWAEN
jgi:hypothetical protein